MNINIMQNTGLKRKLIDKFYTSPDIVNQCINFIEDNIKIEKDDLCIEPSAGDGAFIPGIKSLCNNAKFYDLMSRLFPKNFLKIIWILPFFRGIFKPKK